MTRVAPFSSTSALLQSARDYSAESWRSVREYNYRPLLSLAYENLPQAPVC